MAAVAITLEFFKVGDELCTQRVEVNITDQLQQIRLLLAKDRFIPVLKQMAVPLVPAIMGHRITGKQPAHDRGDWNRASDQQQVEMVRNQRPSKTRCCRFSKDISQPSEKIVTIFVILE